MVQVENLFERCLMVHDKLESSLCALFRNGDVLSCKAACKVADSQFKELAKEVKPLVKFLRSCSQASVILPKIDELVAKEKEMQDMEIALIECTGKILRGKDRETRIVSQQQKLASLKQEVKALLESIADI